MSAEPYYEDEFVRLYHGDCAEVLPDVADVGLVFTSPPYNLGTSLDGSPCEAVHDRPGSLRPNRSHRFADGYDDHEDAMPRDEYEAWQGEVLRMLWSTLRDDGAIFYNHKPRAQGGACFLPTDLVPDGLLLRQVVIWDRCNKAMAYTTHAYNYGHEWIVVLAKEGWRLKSKTASALSDVWHVPPSTQDLGHPCPFPIELPRRAIDSAVVNGVVLDPFAGAGTTLLAAKNAGLRAVGIEKSERYCEVAAARLGSWKHSVAHDGSLWGASR